jgi:hypothetical protein
MGETTLLEMCQRLTPSIASGVLRAREFPSRYARTHILQIVRVAPTRLSSVKKEQIDCSVK